jgi:hypothetical protein
MLKIINTISTVLPPYRPGTPAVSRGHAPTVDDVSMYERQLLAAVQFDTAAVAAQPITLLSTVLRKCEWDPRLQQLVETLLCSRAYTDSDLCLQCSVQLVVAAAVLYLQLVSQHISEQEIVLPDDVTAT